MWHHFYKETAHCGGMRCVKQTADPRCGKTFAAFCVHSSGPKITVAMGEMSQRDAVIWERVRGQLRVLFSCHMYEDTGPIGSGKDGSFCMRTGP